MKINNSESGFTLVELSIVLVIIGLIVSGILVGQDMIRAAEIRSTVSQMESYNTAVNTFRDKYRNIPGDMLQTDAARFGFVNGAATGRTGVAGRGDGNRLLQAGTLTSPADRLLGHETSLFWRDLSQASLIGDNFSTAGAADAVENATTAAAVAAIIPAASIGQGHYFTIHSQGGRNFFSIAQVQASPTAGYTLGAAMTPQTAFNIDDKMDDGNPVSGIVMATFSTGAAAPLGIVYAAAAAAGESIQIPVTAATGAGACAFSTVAGNLANASYNTATDALANNPACQLRIRASF
jgi:prepilin-type N-terminal cleavage/methylation domain-containing protein